MIKGKSSKCLEYEAKIKEMSEEEYDNLDEEERKRIDLLRLQKRYGYSYYVILYFFRNTSIT